MPKVDPDTHEPLTDAPDGPADQRGGTRIGDPDLDDATVTGGHSTRGDQIDDDSRLPGEKPSVGDCARPETDTSSDDIVIGALRSTFLPAPSG